MSTAALALCVRRAAAPHLPGPAVEVRLRVPSEVARIEEAVELLARHCLAGSSSHPRVGFRLRVALSEALANAIICGNGEDPSKAVWVRIEVLPDLMRVHVKDEGYGFDPATVREPLSPDDLDRACGRGLFLIRNLVDDVTFSPQGNAICMTLRRK